MGGEAEAEAEGRRGGDPPPPGEREVTPEEPPPSAASPEVARAASGQEEGGRDPPRPASEAEEAEAAASEAGEQSDAAAAGDEKEEEEGEEASASGLLGLPKGCLEAIVLRLRDPRDVASIGRTCRKLRRVVGEVPLRLRVQGGPETPETARGDVAAQLEGLVATFKNVVELEVVDASVTEDVVQATLDSLPELGWIHIQSCQKVGGRLGRGFTAEPGPAGGPARGCRPLGVSLQRCFRLTWTILRDLLHLNFQPESRIRCAAVSHLDLDRHDELLDLCAAQRVCGREGSLKALGLFNCKHLRPPLLEALAAGLPRLEALFLGGSVVDVPGPGAEYPRALAAALLQLLELRPKLKVLELTHFPRAAVDAVRRGCPRGTRVWDFTREAAVHEAGAFLSSLPAEPSLQLGHHDWHSLIRGGFTCSSLRKQRPLHAAIQARSCPMALELLRFGAAPDVRDKGGNTPLLVAAESGCLELCKLLLAGGADCLAFNTSEESPLYIAALKGEHAIVRLLLAHCTAHGVPWQDSRLYGDGWTPLMAAVLHGSVAVVETLLDAADDPAAFAGAQNRYGQTALHIAARGTKKDDSGEAILRKLLEAGADPGVKDAYGLTAARVAQKQRNRRAASLLKTDWARLAAEKLQALGVEDVDGEWGAMAG